MRKIDRLSVDGFPLPQVGVDADGNPITLVEAIASLKKPQLELLAARCGIATKGLRKADLSAALFDQEV